MAAVVALTVAAVGPMPARADDVEELRARAQTIADRVSALEHELASLRTRKRTLETRISAADHQIAALELDRQTADNAFRAALDEYISRAVDVYKSPSPGANLELILQARSFSELATLTHVTNSSARAARAALGKLLEARAAAEDLQGTVDRRKQRLLADLEAVEALEHDIAGTLADRKAAYDDMVEEIKRLEREARRAARAAASTSLDDILGSSGPAPDIPEGFVSTGVSFEGIASWYGPGFEGNTTANGDIFDPDKFTAASKELPLGSWLYVAHEGKGVVVYVNDRGPYIEGRVLDLSQAAAQAIGITGLGWVRATVIVKG